MSSSGAGRGRGWLNLSKNVEAPKPTGLTQFNPAVKNQTVTTFKVKDEHLGLVKSIRELSEMDDGIKLNEKLRPIYKFWMQECRSKEDVEDSFASVYKVCSRDRDLVPKLLILLSSPAVHKMKFFDCKPRFMFLRHLQDDFENRNELQSTDPVIFRNVVYMLGEYFRKLNPSQVDLDPFLSKPLLSCLELLLNTKSIPDLTQLALELFKSGANLNSSNAERVFLLSTKVRLTLLDSQLSREAKLWLLLINDLISNRFALAPELLQFYEEQLGSNAMAQFQKTDVLSIQTILPSSKILDSYQSDVNVLQISSTSPTDSAQSDTNQSQFNNSSNELNNSFSFQDNNVREKPGRPILGAGARYNKNNKTKDENNEWNKKHNANERSHRRGPPPVLKNNRGWEHDDRFENDY